jgi:hypothetical protein
MSTRDSKRVLGVLGFVSLGVAVLSGCRDNDQRDIPNRVLDRPTDLELICVDCVDTDGDQICDELQAQPRELCERDSGGCTSTGIHLVGFVANSERNEVAMFTKCSNRLVDMDVDSPGYNFIPAGILPTDLTSTKDSCRVVSANVGSCDLSVLDALGLASFGIGPAYRSGQPPGLDEPSSLVSTVVPRTFDATFEGGSFRPLGARPGQLLDVPANLTTAPGLSPGATLEGACDPRIRRSVYISFPSCNLVAEVDLQTGNILQSHQFRTDENGEILVEDTGVSPSCPLECPDQFDGVLPASEELDADGPFPQALELSIGREDLQNEDENQPAYSLFVGGLGSDFVFEIPIDPNGTWGGADETLALELRNAGGVKGIRASPPVEAPSFQTPGFEGEDMQFLYVPVGDGSTRVIGRALGPGGEDILGVECETQLDPSLLSPGISQLCTPVIQTPYEDQPGERRGFSRGPGIRPGNGEEVSDWMFVAVDDTADPDAGEGTSDPNQSATDDEGSTTSSPFAENGTVAVGVTSGGFAIYALIDQYRVSGEVANAESLIRRPADPLDVMDVRLFPHSLWPDGAVPLVDQLPTMLDSDPGRTVPGQGSTHLLAPTLRRVDSFYVDDERRSTQLGVFIDYDQLGGGEGYDPDDGTVHLYDEDVVRAVVHDYRSWGNSGGPNWSLEWEGTIPGTQSTTGRLACDKEGWQGGTCLEGSRLFDETATFCDNGVLPGDKLVIIGCREDDDCGDGRICLRESAGGGDSTGICIPDPGDDARKETIVQMRQVCGNFISDPCGEAYREYTVAEARQDELLLHAMDLRSRSYLADIPCEGVANAVVVEGECACLPGFSVEACGPGATGEECCPEPATLLSGQAPVLEVEGSFTCTEAQPDGDCGGTQDCFDLADALETQLEGLEDEAEIAQVQAQIDELRVSACIDSRCRRRCDDPNECIHRRLPGPACFGEFVRYQVQLRDAFRVSGPNLDFITDRVEVDPAGYCVPTQNPELSQLLTSRLPLPRSDDPDDPDWLAIPVCPNDTVQPGDPNPCRVVTTRGQSVKFYNHVYEDRATVSALRFSNPVLSILLDLSSLEVLTDDVPGYDDSVWPVDFASFRRSRIPRGYRLSFGLNSGYPAFRDRLTLEGRPVTFPLRIVASPEPGVAYIVDGSGSGSSTAIRGQVLRVFLRASVDADQSFTGVR